jgi:hypothetical protein
MGCTYRFQRLAIELDADFAAETATSSHIQRISSQVSGLRRESEQGKGKVAIFEADSLPYKSSVITKWLASTIITENLSTIMPVNRWGLGGPCDGR